MLTHELRQTASKF